jgi:hypothetical protein
VRNWPEVAESWLEKHNGQPSLADVVELLSVTHRLGFAEGQMFMFRKMAPIPTQLNEHVS